MALRCLIRRKTGQVRTIRKTFSDLRVSWGSSPEEGSKVPSGTSWLGCLALLHGTHFAQSLLGTHAPLVANRADGFRVVQAGGQWPLEGWGRAGDATGCGLNREHEMVGGLSLGRSYTNSTHSPCSAAAAPRRLPSGQVGRGAPAGHSPSG